MSDQFFILKQEDRRLPCDCTITANEQYCIEWDDFVKGCAEIEIGDYVSLFGLVANIRDQMIIKLFAASIIKQYMVEEKSDDKKSDPTD